MTSIQTFLQGIVTAATGGFTIALVAVGLLIAGAVWVYDHKSGKAVAVGALGGGALMLMANQISTQLNAMPH